MWGQWGYFAVPCHQAILQLLAALFKVPTAGTVPRTHSQRPILIIIVHAHARAQMRRENPSGMDSSCCCLFSFFCFGEVLRVVITVRGHVWFWGAAVVYLTVSLSSRTPTWSKSPRTESTAARSFASSCACKPPYVMLSRLRSISILDAPSIYYIWDILYAIVHDRTPCSVRAVWVQGDWGREFNGGGLRGHGKITHNPRRAYPGCPMHSDNQLSPRSTPYPNPPTPIPRAHCMVCIRQCVCRTWSTWTSRPSEISRNSSSTTDSIWRSTLSCANQSREHANPSISFFERYRIMDI
eukprot:COSAG05_NODE_612_length_8357_cov_40.832647_10_plen_296_part_00